MFTDSVLQDHLNNSATIKTRSAVIAEWNMNMSDNIKLVGNYRYRPFSEDSLGMYRSINNEFDIYDEGNYYTDATLADVVIDGGYYIDNEKNAVPETFRSIKEKESMLYSLEDCFNRFRPRSGINKLRYFPGNYLAHQNVSMAKRPRHYMADKNDIFKYWTSYRTENGKEYGMSRRLSSGLDANIIEDTSPFVVYKEPVPANRIVVKMQTGVGEVDLGSFYSGSLPDPFYGLDKASTPKEWRIQVLKNNSWIDIKRFTRDSIRRDTSPVIKADGYLELEYGLIVPEQYYSVFVSVMQIPSVDFLPESSINGYAYLVKGSDNSVGQYHMWLDDLQQYVVFDPIYGWDIAEDEMSPRSKVVTDLVSPESFIDPNNKIFYREFESISGIRIVVDSMNIPDCPFDLIEMSPRLAADIEGMTKEFSITKQASDIGTNGLPVGQLLASTGSISIFDYDMAFNPNNPESIIGKYSTKNLQIKFFEVISDLQGYDYFVPIKTMYAENFPEVSFKERSVVIQLRDLFFLFESQTAPQILIRNASLSYVISLLLDSVGFSNYVFKRAPNEHDPVIPFFFVPNDKSIAEILNEIAVSTQTAMFFDEYNNFVLMTKEYMLPSEDVRGTDITLYGSIDSIDTGIVENSHDGVTQTNIKSIASQQNHVYNDGRINFTSRSIQRQISSAKQADKLDYERTWTYKNVLMWEVSGDESPKSVNEEVGNQSTFGLAAIPLTTDVSGSAPYVSNNRVVNNTIDLGEAIYFLPRYNGYFYANGEVIKYDAVQFNVPGISVADPNNKNIDNADNVWITNVREYQNYMYKLPFNGKIFPTGLVRIFSEPHYETIDAITRIKNGDVKKHGRGQFGTTIVEHSAGLPKHWSSNDNAYGMNMLSKYMFGSSDATVSTLTIEKAIIPQESQAFIYVTSIEGLIAGQSATIDMGDGVISTVVLGTIPAETDTMEDKEKNKYYKVPVSVGVNADGSKDKEATVTIDKTQDYKLYTDIAGEGFGKLIKTEITSNDVARSSTRNGIIKNFMATNYLTETEVNRLSTPAYGTVQSSALVFQGPSLAINYTPIDFMSYIVKPLDNKFTHFGTRLRIIGRIDNNDVRGQTPTGSDVYYTATVSKAVTSYDRNGNQVEVSPAKSISVGGSSGGLGIFVNQETNEGYFFEIVALTENNVSSYVGKSFSDLIFYKTMKEKTPEGDVVKAIPVKLWQGNIGALVDDGSLTGMARVMAEDKPTVYDLSIEYETIGSQKKFMLFVNGMMVGTVIDKDPLKEINNVCLFVRGTSRLMFENIYAISNSYSQNASFQTGAIASSIFGGDEIDVTESFRKYAMTGVLKSTYLTGISASEPPKYNLYFEEFGTIMREAAYFNVKYDKAYPALYAKLAPTINSTKGYVVSGFRAGAYGAEFMVFNSTDSFLKLDSSSGNYLRILGITFTQESAETLSVDEFYSKISDFSNPQFDSASSVISPINATQDVFDLRHSRSVYGKKDFTLEASYIQSKDEANDMMKWILSKIVKPRISIGVEIFSNPTIQLGDIVSVNYKDRQGVDIVAPSTSRFVVYNIEYSKSVSGPTMTVYLSEVV